MHEHDNRPTEAALATFAAAGNAARTALGDEPFHPLDAVAWLSAHLATEERVLARSVAHPLQEELRWLEQVHSGDALVTGRDAEQQRRRVLGALDAYADVERGVLESVLTPLADEQRSVLVAAYRHGLEVAPTRPHPHLPSRGPAGAIAFRIEAWWDRAMNTMDSRHVPTPRRRRAVPEAGRWTGYLMGGMPAVEVPEPSAGT
jgi:hypothetical protein